MSLRSNDSLDLDFHPRESRPRRTYSIDLDDDSPTAALREGIHEAKEAVHQMGDVLDTPRMTPQRRSPVPKSDLGHGSDISHHTTESQVHHKKLPDFKRRFTSPRSKTDKNKEERKALRATEKLDNDDTSSLSSFSVSDEEDSVNKSESPHRKSEKKLNANHKPLQFTILSLPSEASTHNLEQTGNSEPVKGLQILDGLSICEDTTKPRKSKPHSSEIDDYVPKLDNRPVVRENDLFETPVIKKTSPTSSHAKTEEFESDHGRTSDQFSPSEDNLQPRTRKKVPRDHVSEDFVETKPPIHPETGKSTGVSSTTTPSQTELNASSEAQPLESKQTISLSLLPDDRPTLIQEVTKAREEARKWFSEVTQSDRERRELGRRLEELENELVRLRNVEDR